MTFGGDIFLNSFNGPKGCNIGDWEGDARYKGDARESQCREGLSGMSSEG